MTREQELSHDLAAALSALQQILKHARQGQVDPQFAKDQCWEIEQHAAAVLKIPMPPTSSPVQRLGEAE